MKNKVRLIDITIVSSYMGRFLTAIVAAVVIAITISALFSKGGVRDHQTLILSVDLAGTLEETLRQYQPLRKIIADETGRRVELRPRDSSANNEFELAVMTVRDFLNRRDDGGLVPVYSVCPMDGGRDSAVLISRSGWDPAGLDSVGPDDVIFADRTSLNAFWLQLGILEAGGFAPPSGLDGLNFDSERCRASRVVLEVLLGGYTLGACRRSDLAEMISTGVLRKNEIDVVRAVPALPEMVFVCHVRDLDYYEEVFRSISTCLAAPERCAKNENTLLLLKATGVRSLRPVIAEELAAASELYSQMQSRNRTGKQ